MHNNTWKLILSDLYRYNGDISSRAFFRNFLINPGFKCTFYYRICKHFVNSKNPLCKCFFYFIFVINQHNTLKYGISLPYQANIGSGFYVGHFGNIIVSPGATIGKNCNISQGVTIGVHNRGDYKGIPIIGDNVYIGPGAKIFGGIKIGNNVAIGANCVVTKDIPEYSVVVGVPGKVISSKGSIDYVINTDYNFLKCSIEKNLAFVQKN